MMTLGKFLSRWRKPAITDAEIMAAVDPWMRFCAVSAYNGTLSTSGNMTFKLWLSCCQDTWVGEVAAKVGVSLSRVNNATRKFAKANADREEELEQELRPGESMTIPIHVRLK